MAIDRLAQFPHKLIPASVAYLPIALAMSLSFASPLKVEAQVVPKDFDGSPTSVAVVRRSLKANETEQPWRDKDPNRFLRVIADFYGAGSDQVASLFADSTAATHETLTVDVVKTPGVSRWLGFELPFDKLAVTGIRLVEPGVYETACGKGQRKCQPGEPKKLTLERPAISLFEYEGAETIYYWDIETRSYIGVEMGT